MGKQLLLLLFLFISNVSFSQERYSADLFDEISIETYTYTTKDGQNLDLDVYTPEYDDNQERACIVYMHGGGFSGGERDGESIKKFCTHLANYGYVVSSISYRLTRKGAKTGFGCNCPANEKINTLNAAVEDLLDATHFLIDNRQQFGINPQKMILAGSSAGAETVLTAAYQPPFCFGLESGPVKYAGVIGMAGAIVDTTAIYDESAIPSLLFHGTDDSLVPYATAPHHYCTEEKEGYLILHGSHTIAEKLNKLEVPCWLHTSCGAGHELHSLPFTNYFDTVIEFCHTFIIEEKGDQRHTIINGKQNTEKFNPYNFCKE